MSEEFQVLANHLTKVFPHTGGLPAVHDVSFGCKKGEVFGLLGPNGAGKTTTLRMLSTVLEPTIGTASVCGYDVRREAREVRGQIGFLSGNTALYPRLSVRETLRFFGTLHGLRGDYLDSAIQRVVEALDMEGYADKRLETLSTGMAQKANIGRTLLHDPPVLILDEPTNGLDILGSASMLDFVEKMKHEGKCVVYSTHIMSEAERLCDRIGILHSGKLYEVGTLDELKAKTQREYLDQVFLSLLGQAAGQA